MEALLERGSWIRKMILSQGFVSEQKSFIYIESYLPWKWNENYSLLYASCKIFKSSFFIWIIASVTRLAFSGSGSFARRSITGPLIHHSDRGSQYTATSYQALLQERGIQLSMSRRANCWDNAMLESFWGCLKVECLYRSSFSSHSQARTAIFAYIEVFYNRQRRHSRLGYLSPFEFESSQVDSVCSRVPV
jgi:putative transposase